MALFVRNELRIKPVTLRQPPIWTWRRGLPNVAMAVIGLLVGRASWAMSYATFGRDPGIFQYVAWYTIKTGRLFLSYFVERIQKFLGTNRK